MKNIVMISPGFPLEQAYFTRALAQTGAQVIGVGDQPVGALPQEARDNLAHYEHVSLADTSAVLRALKGLSQHARIDQVECLWEPYVVLAAQIREHLGLEGMSVEQATWFRDKEQMKLVLDRAGIRTPRHASARTAAEIWDAAEQIGYPLIIKPIAGAGSADTYRVDSAEELATVQTMITHVGTMSVEEFIDGEEFTYDTVCIDGRPAFENVAQYLPRPLIARTNEWISPVICTVRDLAQPTIRPGIELGRGVLKALGMGSGFTHMEWYRTRSGEVVFGEIGCRPGGARLVDQMNFTCDIDLFREWGRAVTTGRFDASTERLYNTAIIFKRALGQGRITRHEGLAEFKRRFGRWICAEELLPVGAHRRDWLQTLVSDGWIMVRHPNWGDALELANIAATQVTLYAGG